MERTYLAMKCKKCGVSSLFLLTLGYCPHCNERWW